MHYADLKIQTQNLGPGYNAIYELPEGKVEIRNMGVRHPMLTGHIEYRLDLTSDHRMMVPRHGDFFVDYLLKIETRPDLRLAFTEACEQVCNGTSPQAVMQAKKLPRLFESVSDANYSKQKSFDQTGGMPTELFLCGLQGLIRVYELNESLIGNVPEAFRKAFLGIEKGQSCVEVVKPLQPQIMPGKRYFNRTAR